MSPRDHLLNQIEQRILENGQVLTRSGGEFRSDAIAWAIIACQKYLNLYESKKRLVEIQRSDGRVPLFPDCPEVWWTTALAIMAWASDPLFDRNANSAIEFLLSHGGKTTKNNESSIIGDNTEIQGWPWVEGTYSWIEPTCMSILACESVGIIEHPRLEEGRRLIIDRMIEHGGWNFGNKSVFGKVFPPIIEYTGMALCVLNGNINTADRDCGLFYLQNEYKGLRTPIALSWTIMGLSANHARPDDAEEKIKKCLEFQSAIGEYDTVSLALLLTALHENPFEGCGAK